MSCSSPFPQCNTISFFFIDVTNARETNDVEKKTDSFFTDIDFLGFLPLKCVSTINHIKINHRLKIQRPVSITRLLEARFQGRVWSENLKSPPQNFLSWLLWIKLCGVSAMEQMNTNKLNEKPFCFWWDRVTKLLQRLAQRTQTSSSLPLEKKKIYIYCWNTGWRFNYPPVFQCALWLCQLIPFF